MKEKQELTVTIENAIDGRVKRFTLPAHVTVRSVIAALVKKWKLPLIEEGEEPPYSLVHVLDPEMKVSDIPKAVQHLRLRLIPIEPQDSGEGEHTTLGFFPGLVRPMQQTATPQPSPEGEAREEMKSTPITSPRASTVVSERNAEPERDEEEETAGDRPPLAQSEKAPQRGAYMVVSIPTNKKRRLALPKAAPIRRLLPVLGRQFGLDRFHEPYRLRHEGEDLDPDATLATIPEESELEILIGPRTEIPITIMEETSGREIGMRLPQDLRTPWLIRKAEHFFGPADPEGIMEYELFYENRHLLPYDTLQSVGVRPHDTLKLIRVERTVFVHLKNLIDGDESKIYLPYTRPLKDLLGDIATKMRIPQPDGSGRFLYKIFHEERPLDLDLPLSKTKVQSGDRLDVLISRPATVFVRIVEEEGGETVGIPISNDVQVREILPGIIHRLDLPIAENSLPIIYRLRFGDRVLAPTDDLRSAGIEDLSTLVLFREQIRMINVTVVYPNTGDRINIDLPGHLPISQIISILTNRMGVPVTDRKGEIPYSLQYEDHDLDPDETLEDSGIEECCELTLVRRAS